jgi:hypothetical protein
VYSNTEVVREVVKYLETPNEFIDTNVATHLIRMALSNGKGQQYLSRMLSMPSQLARRWRDDMTVQIVFFQSLKEILPPTKVQKLQRCS